MLDFIVVKNKQLHSFQQLGFISWFKQNTLPVGGDFVPSLFYLAVLYIRHRPGVGGPNGPANIPHSEVVIKAGWGAERRLCV